MDTSEKVCLPLKNSLNKYVFIAVFNVFNEIHLPHNRHHKVSSIMKFHQNTQNYIKYEASENILRSWGTEQFLLAECVCGDEGGKYHPVGVVYKNKIPKQNGRVPPGLPSSPPPPPPQRKQISLMLSLPHQKETQWLVFPLIYKQSKWSKDIRVGMWDGRTGGTEVRE